MYRAFSPSTMPEQRTILQAWLSLFCSCPSVPHVGKTSMCMAMDWFMKTGWMRSINDTRTSRCQHQDHFSLSSPLALQSLGKLGMERMCETCNHGYLLALSLVTRFRQKTLAVVVDQLWSKQEIWCKRGLLLLSFFILKVLSQNYCSKNKHKSLAVIIRKCPSILFYF